MKDRKKRISAAIVAAACLAALLFAACSGKKVDPARESENGGATKPAETASAAQTAPAETEVPAETAAPTEAPEEKPKYCFYVKDDAIYFVDSKRATPVRLTDDLMNGQWHENSSLSALAGTLICRYNEKDDVAFFTDHGSTNLYYKFVSDASNPSVHVADGVASGYTRYISAKKTIYYLTLNLDLYEYDMASGNAAFVESRVNNVTSTEDADIAFRVDGGKWYRKNVGEEKQEYEPDFGGGSAGSSGGSDGSTLLCSYPTGEKYYLKFVAESKNAELCFSDGTEEYVIFSHKKGLYSFNYSSKTPVLSICFSESDGSDGGAILAIKDKIVVLSENSRNLPGVISASGTKVAFVAPLDEERAGLYTADIEGFGIGEPVFVDTGITRVGSASSYAWFDGEDYLYYAKRDQSGIRLFCEGKMLATDPVIRVDGRQDGVLYFRTNEDNDIYSTRYSLCSAYGGSVIKILDAVYCRQNRGGGSWAIGDYNGASYTGNLYFYKDGEWIMIDSGVINII